MRATSIATTAVLALGLGTLGACTAEVGDSQLGDSASSVDEGAGDGDLDGEFGGEDGDPSGTPTDPDDHSGGGPDLDFPHDDLPLDFPHDLPLD
jgi:hypothetical protein